MNCRRDKRIRLSINVDEAGDVTPPPSGPAQTAVARNAGQPSTTCLPRTELVRMLPGLEQRLLGQILRRVDVSGEVHAQAHKPSALREWVADLLSSVTHACCCHRPSLYTMHKLL